MLQTDIVTFRAGIAAWNTKQDWVAFMSQPYWVEVKVEVEVELKFSWNWVEVELSWGWYKRWIKEKLGFQRNRVMAQNMF